jgi:hypothetical protein
MPWTRCRGSSATSKTWHAAFVGGMSNNPEARMAAMQLDEAARRCEEAAHYLSQAPPKARAWAEQMVSGARAAGPRATRGGQRPDTPSGGPAIGEGPREKDGTKPADDKSSRPAVGDDSADRDGTSPEVSDDDARDMLKKLPVRRDQPGHREKTRGLWRDTDGAEREWISGFDDWRDKADRFAVAEKLGDAPHLLQITSHVEIKFAMFMREKGLRRASLVVNKPPCLGESGCDEMLKDFLPKGSKLTVYGPNNFKETYPKKPKPERTDMA